MRKIHYIIICANLIFGVIIVQLHLYKVRIVTYDARESGLSDGWLESMRFMNDYAEMPLFPCKTSVVNVQLGRIENLDPSLSSHDLLELPIQYTNANKDFAFLDGINNRLAIGAALSLSPNYEYVIKIKSSTLEGRNMDYVFVVDSTCSVIDIFLNKAKLNKFCVPLSSEAQTDLKQLLTVLGD